MRGCLRFTHGIPNGNCLLLTRSPKSTLHGNFRVWCIARARMDRTITFSVGCESNFSPCFFRRSCIAIESRRDLLSSRFFSQRESRVVLSSRGIPLEPIVPRALSRESLRTFEGELNKIDKVSTSGERSRDFVSTISTICLEPSCSMFLRLHLVTDH